MDENDNEFVRLLIFSFCKTCSSCISIFLARKKLPQSSSQFPERTSGCIWRESADSSWSGRGIQLRERTGTVFTVLGIRGAGTATDINCWNQSNKLLCLEKKTYAIHAYSNESFICFSFSIKFISNSNSTKLSIGWYVKLSKIWKKNSK